jgi:uncharacterized surface protein with fasciclin (FAS1) repeats
MRKLSLLVLVIALLAFAVAPSLSAQEGPATIAEAVLPLTEGDSPEFTVLLAAVLEADPIFLQQVSTEDTGITVFAPTDAAFTALFEALEVTPEDVLANTDLLNTVLAYHVVPTVLTAENVVALDGAYVGTFLYHEALQIVLDGENVTVDGVNVVAPDAIVAGNGVVHVIDSVLVPQAAMDMLAGEMMEDDMMMEEMGSIAEVAAGAEGFSTLLAAVGAADPSILAVLSNEAPYTGQPLTVFAPTDDAFAAAFEALGAQPADILANTDLVNTVLAYHVAPGNFDSEDVAGLLEMNEEGFKLATALPGSAVTITTDGTNIFVNNATITAVDIMADNGIIHVIDTVLLPQ